jgi:hypothetical protein
VQFNQPDAPFTLAIQLSNSSDAPLQGTLRLRVIDRWRAEPGGPVPFTVRPHSRAPANCWKLARRPPTGGIK